MKKWMAALLSLSLALSLTACGGGTKAPAQSGEEPAAEEAAPAAEPEAEAEEDSVVGIYKLTSLLEDGEESEDMASFQALGMKFFIILEADGSGSMEMFGEVSKVKWDSENLYVIDEESGEQGEPTAYTYANGELSFEDEGTSMVFTKLTEEELADYEENGSGSFEDFLEGLDLDSFQAEIPEGEPSEGPVSGEIDGNPVTILGAEHVEEDGKNYLRVYYNFTNNGEEADSAFMVIYFNAAQDGESLTASMLGEDNAIPEDEADMTDIEPGETILCTEIYEYNPEGGTVGIRFSDLDDEDILLYYADPQNLSGPPAG